MTALGLPRSRAPLGKRAILGSLALVMSLGLLPGAARAFTRQGLPVPQLGARNVETSVYTIYTCDSPGENGRIYYLYMYVNRPPGSPLYRLIIYPNFGQSVGGHDWRDHDLLLDFVARGCHSIVGKPPR
jgi:hypothetical protein